MSTISRRLLLAASTAFLGLSALGTFAAEKKVPQVDGAYEAATKATIDWRKLPACAG